MEHDILTNLPQEIMIDILLRLPTGSIMSCKCVCKSLRDLIKTRDFVESHSSRSVPRLALFQRTISTAYRIIENLDIQNLWKNPCSRRMVLNVNFPRVTTLQGSANGLLFLLNNTGRMPCICNPITREYVNVKLPPPMCNNQFGFGVSKLTSEYKVVRLFYEGNPLTTPRKCEVYSLRIGLWRSVATAGDQLLNAQLMSSPISLNGNLHWLVYSEYPFLRVLCFDLETECFRTFSIARLPYLHYRSMCALGDRLCVLDYSPVGFVIWSMIRYGDDESWAKECVIELQGPYTDQLRGVVPNKVFKDGDILFLQHNDWTNIYCYSSKTRTIRKIDVAKSVFNQTMFVYTPSFVPLKTLTRESNVFSY